jgi:putative SOS response-associated peptidase YedK
MCGRFALSKETDELIAEFVAAGGRPEDWRPAWSIAPTNNVPIVRDAVSDTGEIQRELTMARWDWPKPANQPSGPPIINARIEKLPTGFWVGAFSNSRCIVPMAPGYLEWTGERGDKQPHLIYGDGVLAAAGLTWTAEIADERQRIFVVVTREARDASGEIHDRMPAFLTRDLWDDWLNPASLTVDGDTVASKRNRAELLDELDASSSVIAATMRTHLVDRRLNNTRTVDRYDPTLLEPLQ